MVPRKHVEAAEARHMKSGTKWCMCMVRNAAFCIMRLVVLQAAIDMVRSELDSHGDPQVSGATVMNTRMTTDRQTGRKWLSLFHNCARCTHFALGRWPLRRSPMLRSMSAALATTSRSSSSFCEFH